MGGRTSTRRRCKPTTLPRRRRPGPGKNGLKKRERKGERRKVVRAAAPAALCNGSAVHQRGSGSYTGSAVMLRYSSALRYSCARHSPIHVPCKHKAREEAREAVGDEAVGRPARPSICLQRQPDASTHVAKGVKRTVTAAFLSGGAGLSVNKPQGPWELRILGRGRARGPCSSVPRSSTHHSTSIECEAWSWPGPWAEALCTPAWSIEWSILAVHGRGCRHVEEIPPCPCNAQWRRKKEAAGERF